MCGLGGISWDIIYTDQTLGTMQWNKDTILKVMIVGKPAGQLHFFLICQEFKQKSPANMNVAIQISIDISRKKNASTRRLYCWEE